MESGWGFTDATSKRGFGCCPATGAASSAATIHMEPIRIIGPSNGGAGRDDTAG
jgi:hypothetical protein